MVVGLAFFISSFPDQILISVNRGFKSCAICSGDCPDTTRDLRVQIRQVQSLFDRNFRKIND